MLTQLKASNRRTWVLDRLDCRQQEAQSWLDYYRPFWEKRLDALEQFVARKQREGLRADQDVSGAAGGDV